MTSPFFGLDIATRALRSAQSLVDISNQNISNANTPGYSRQTAVIKETAPYPIPVFRQSGQLGQMGTGVEVAEVNRARDTFADYQYRTQVAAQGNWQAQADTLSQVEATINEPSTSGLSSLMTKYFQSWQEVANSPSDVSVRSNMLQQGVALADSFKNTVDQLSQQKSDVDQQIGLSVGDINNYSQQIANLNVQISTVQNSGMQPNDLRDQRDLLVDKLSAVMKVTTIEAPDGSLNIYVGNHQLVDRNTAHQVGVDSSGPTAQLVWKDGTNAQLTVADGKLAGLVTSRDTILQGRIDAINNLASRVITSVNAIHAAGVGLDGTGGMNFFSGTNATDMAINPNLTANNIAAAQQQANSSGGYTHAIGDSTNAVALAQLESALSTASSGLATGQTVGTSTVLGVNVGEADVNRTFIFSVSAGATPSDPPTVTISDGTRSVNATWTVASDRADGVSPTRDIYTLDTGSLGVRLTLSAAAGTNVNTALAGLDTQSVTTTGPATINDQYGKEIAAIGVLAATANGQNTNQQVLVKQLDNQRQNTMGVSLDEETTNLIQYQHAYQASARVISVMNDMLDTLINLGK
jgi:flagellar hook-associated protein 1 FlgK